MSERLRIAFLDTKASNVNHYIYLSIAAALRRHPAVEAVIAVDYGNALELARDRRANFFLAYDGEELNTEICRRLRERCGFAALWITDDPYELHYNLESADTFDLIFTNDESSAPAYGFKGRYLPLAGDRETHLREVRKEGDPGLRYDVFFAGVAWPNRVRLIGSLMRDLPEVNFKIALVGNEHLPDVELPERRSAYTFRTAPRDFANLANASRITLGLHRDFAGTPQARSRTDSPPPRLFEAALAGSLQLVPEEMAGVSKAFEPGREIATFGHYRDCVEAIQAMLADPRRRVAIATAAQQRALREHTYDARVATLLEMCAGRSAETFSRSAPVAERPRVLMVAHNVVGGAPHGGAEIYVDSLTRWLAGDFDVFTYSYVAQAESNRFVVLGPRGEQVERVEFDGTWRPFTFSNATKERHFADLLVRHRISLVHYHHLIGHPPSLPLISRALGIPSVFTLHDYHGVCDSFALIDYEQRYCRIDQRDERVCEHCTERRTGLGIGAQAARRALFSRVFATADAICVSSEAVRSLYARFYPEIAQENVRVLPVPMPETEGRLARMAAPRFTDGADVPLQIVSLGNFSPEKGAYVLLEAARALRDEPVRFHVYGRADREVRNRAQELGLTNLRLHGEYEAIDLPSILESADATVHLSIWPETYCIALSEAWAYRRVPIVSNIGALGERVTHGVDGLTVAPDDAGDLVRTIREVLASPALLATIAKRIGPHLYPAARDHARALAALYRDAIGRARIDVGPNPGGRHAGLTLADCGITLAEPELDRKRQLADATRVIDFSTTVRPSEPLVGRPLTPIGMLTPFDNNALRVHVDEIAGGPPGREAIVRTNAETFSIRGWRIDETGKRPGNARLMLVDVDEGRAYAAAVASEDRPDVADTYRSPSFLHSGFRSVVSLAGVRAGSYRLVIDDDGRLAALALPPLVVQMHLETDRSFAGVDRSPARLDAALVEINGVSVAGLPADPVPVNGRLSCAGTVPGDPGGAGSRFYVVLESALDGYRHYARVRVLPGGDEARPEFAADLDVCDVPSAVYRLSIAALRAGVFEESDALAEVELGVLP